MSEPASPASPPRAKFILIGVSCVLLLTLIGIFIMAHTVPSFQARSAVPDTCAVVICERGRGRAAEQVRSIRKNMAAFGDKIHVLAYNGAAGMIDGATLTPMGTFVDYQTAAIDASTVVGGRFVFLGDQTVPLRKMCIGDMFSATGKFRFFGGDDTDDTDAAFKMYNETIAPVVVFDQEVAGVAGVDEEYIYKLHFSKRLRHASDMTFDVFMMRDHDMNRTQVELAKDSGRMMATFHLPNDALAKLTSDERAQKNAELVELMSLL